MTTVVRLALCNLFMATAWYWHVRSGAQAVEARPLVLVIAISWGIALIVFGGFMVVVLKEPLHWRHLAAFGCIMAAVGFLFTGK